MQDSNKGLKAISTWGEALCVGEGPSSMFLIILWDLLLLNSMFSEITCLLMPCPGPDIGLLLPEGLGPGTWPARGWTSTLQHETSSHGGLPRGVHRDQCWDPLLSTRSLIWGKKAENTAIRLGGEAEILRVVDTKNDWKSLQKDLRRLGNKRADKIQS